MTKHLDHELSLLLDGELDGDALVGAESHLLECADCRAALEGLKAVKRRAAALGDRAPVRDLWGGGDGIAQRISAAPHDAVAIGARRARRGVGRRFSFSMPQLAAAAVALMAVSAGAAAVLLARSQPLPAGTALLEWPAAAVVTPVVNLDKAPGGAGIATYDAAIQEIEVTLRTRRTVLDTATVRVVERSLRIIDEAVRQAREALARDPNNLYLNSHLQNALDRKLDLLRRVATLPTVS